MKHMIIAILTLAIVSLACGQPPVLTTPTPAATQTPTATETATLPVYPTVTLTPTATLGCDGCEFRLATAVHTPKK